MYDRLWCKVGDICAAKSKHRFSRYIACSLCPLCIAVRPACCKVANGTLENIWGHQQFYMITGVRKVVWSIGPATYLEPSVGSLKYVNKASDMATILYSDLTWLRKIFKSYLFNNYVTVRYNSWSVCSRMCISHTMTLSGESSV